MTFPLTTVIVAPKPFFTFPALISLLLILSHGFITAAKTNNDTKHTNKEAKTAIKLAVQNFNNNTKNYKLSHDFRNSGADPFQDAYTGKSMKIGVPHDTSFKKLMNPDMKNNSFCSKLFNKVREILEEKSSLHCEFKLHNGTYDELIEGVYKGTYDAAVGDITILAKRWKLVEFTQPFLESRLVMIAPVKSETKAWLFMKPFTKEMWIVTAAILIYTMFMIWFLEHQSNSEFRGPWTNQLGTAFWFTFSSLFFSHREKIESNLARVVLIVWMFVVLILTTTYTASLTSMLTLTRLEPKVGDIQWLKNNNSTVGCDKNSFVRQYLEHVLKFSPDNIKPISSEDDYIKAFESGNITAAFLELPYGKLFINDHCKGYTLTEPVYIRFAGLGFVFRKGSLIAANVSKAILHLSENGDLKDMEDELLSAPPECSAFETTSAKKASLNLQGFWGLYGISGATSTICFLLFLIPLLKKHLCPQEKDGGNCHNFECLEYLQYFHNAEIKISGPYNTFIMPEIKISGTPTTLALTHTGSSARSAYLNPSGNPGHLQSSPPVIEIEMI